VLDGLESEGVFAVEVGREDERAAGREFVEALLEDFVPDLFVVPEVLVTEKDDVEGVAEFLVGVDIGGVGGEEFEGLLGGGAGALGLGEFLEVLAAAGLGVGDFALPDVDADEFDLGGGLRGGGGI
jgi:hypothetical protein